METSRNVIIILIMILVPPLFGQSISRKDLLLLVQSKQDSIADIRIDYTSSRTDQEGHTKGPVSFAKDGWCAFYKTESSGLCRNETGNLNYQIDGDGYITGMIKSPQDTIPSIYGGGLSPMGAYMMIDTKKVFGMEILAYDLVALLQKEERLQIKDEGEKLSITYGTPIFVKVVLNPEKNFAVERFEEYTTGYSQDGNTITYSELKTETAFSNFYEAGDGIWFAKDIDRVYYDIKYEDGKVKKDILNKYSFKVDKIEINKGIDKKEFTDFIPAGADIYDAVSGISYINGGDMSVDGAIFKKLQEFKNEDIANASHESSQNTQKNRNDVSLLEKQNESVEKPKVVGNAKIDMNKKTTLFSCHFILLLVVVLGFVTWVLFFGKTFKKKE